MSPEKEQYQTRQTYLLRIASFIKQLELIMPLERDRMVYMGMLPDQVERMTSREPDWPEFKHWVFQAIIYLQQELDDQTD